MLTRAGKLVLALGVATALAGWGFQYRPLVAVALGCFTALAVALAVVARPPNLEVQRVVDPQRVLAGNPGHDELTITNIGRRPSRGATALERFGDAILAIQIPPLLAGEGTTIVNDLPTFRRGIYQVGPLSLNRSDPLSLARRGTWRTDLAQLIVHPTVHDVDPFPSGRSRDLDGPNSGEAPEGGVAFQNLREYVEGDDLRLIHWRSSARTDRMMVRHNVDTHQPRSLILFDTRRTAYGDDAFEDAVRCAASLAIASRKRNFPFRLVSTGGLRVDQAMSGHQLLDELAGLDFATDASTTLYDLVRQASHERGGYSLTLVTGHGHADDLVHISPLRGRFEKVTIVRIGPHSGTESLDLPGALLINAATSQDFARSWNMKVRR